MLFALGERWTVGRWQAPVRSPAIVLRHLPVVNNIRMPYRWSWPGLLVLTLAAGLVLDRRVRVLDRSRRGRMVAVVCLVPLGILSLVESRWNRVEVSDLNADPILTPPGLIEAVRNGHREGSVAVLPFWDFIRPMRWQIRWGLDIPMASGYVARIPPHGRNPIRQPVWTAEAEAWLRARKVSTIIITVADARGTWDKFAEEALRAIPGLRIIRESDFSDPFEGKGSGFDPTGIP
jgi:hypothetical protein